ncbi:hypothetical protein GIB67_020029 [Kingdonia uniflora]|uniref:WEB family protein n=1 Tax=Kingdonia uniflora TaxID=39325 RepID=A0A7J7N4B8_9MAGN|nr:hypothetical protein GIB67_020029 [Kingdonia uniflora]
MMEREDGDAVWTGRAEIDTRAPFQSVKEAVMLFGERVLAGEVYANKLKEIQAGSTENIHCPSRVGSIVAELEETKQSLDITRQNSLVMEHCLASLREELEQTKRELHQLKAKESMKQRVDSGIEDLKFIEHATKIEIKSQDVYEEEPIDFQKKRYVKFASPPSLARVMSSEGSEEILERHFSSKKKKRKPLIPLLGRMFSKKSGNQEVASPRGRSL